MKTAMLRRGSTDRELFHDVSAINDTLAQREQTSSLFAEICGQDVEFARKCFSSARPALLQTHNYDLARKFIRSPKETLERLAGRLNRNLAGDAPEPSTSSAILQKAEIDNYIEDVQHLIEILEGVCEVEEAQRLRTAAVTSLSSVPIREYVIEHLRRPA